MKLLKNLKACDLIIHRLAIFLLSLMLILSLIFSIAAIFLRWANISIMWTTTITRNLVFFMGLLGGIVAIGKEQHISIDLLRNFLSYKNKIFLSKITNLVSSILCFFLGISGYLFAKIEFEHGVDGIWVVIIPICFFMMSFRFLCKVILDKNKC